MIPGTFKPLFLMIICEGTTVPSLTTWPLPLNVKNALLCLSQIFRYLVHSFCLNIFNFWRYSWRRSFQQPGQGLHQAWYRCDIKEIALLNEWIHTCLSYLPDPKSFEPIWSSTVQWYRLWNRLPIFHSSYATYWLQFLATSSVPKNCHIFPYTVRPH